MLIRFIVKNLLSFKEQTEFNLLPNKSNRLSHHRYDVNGLPVLKMSALYGANGSGKSNFIAAIDILKKIVVADEIPSNLENIKFRLCDETKLQPIDLGIEFFHEDLFFYYSVSINNGKIIDEYLSNTNPTKGTEELIFHRKEQESIVDVDFDNEFNKSEENLLLKKILIKNLVQPEKSLVKTINADLNSENVFERVKKVFDWFKNELVIIYPHTRPVSLASSLDSNKEMMSFANNLFASFDTGVNNIKVHTSDINEFIKSERFIGDINEEIDELKENPEKKLAIRNSRTKEDILIVNEDGEILIKRLTLEHKNEDGKCIDFNVSEESDGTRRLMEYIPAINGIVHKSRTYIIDEIERSLHPNLIKEIIAKLSNDTTTKGQLIFTTHESNLLDQEIIRTDEIWFAEKNKYGSTKLYSLSDFKVHSTIDIRKGYLNGRYGAIPFTANLQDINWD